MHALSQTGGRGATAPTNRSPAESKQPDMQTRSDSGVLQVEKEGDSLGRRFTDVAVPHDYTMSYPHRVKRHSPTSTDHHDDAARHHDSKEGTGFVPKHYYRREMSCSGFLMIHNDFSNANKTANTEIGRASCRERVSSSV
jgi:hypothetical protein